MSVDVFVSYRRDDAGPEAGRIADAVRRSFGEDSVFLDASDIQPGADWPATLRRMIEDSRAVIVVLGPEWILARDEYGRRRIDDPRDWVRQEIHTALSLHKLVIPILVRRSRMPPAEALPPSIAELGSRQAFEVRAESWTHDIQLIVDTLADHLGAIARPQVAYEHAGSGLPSVTLDDFRAIALGFESRNVDVRRSTADQIKQIALYFSVDEILTLARSGKISERVGVAIALGAHVRSERAVREDRRVLAVLGELLSDHRSSLIRYRAAEVLRSSPALVDNYKDDLRYLAQADSNPYVRQMAGTALRNVEMWDRSGHTRSEGESGA